MPVPYFKVNNGIDYADYIKQISPSLNDLDADGSGRNLLDGEMHRSRIATKDAWAVDIDRMDAKTMSNFLTDMYSEGNYVHITILDPKKNKHVKKEYFFSTINIGVQRKIGTEVYYDGGSLTITER